MNEKLSMEQLNRLSVDDFKHSPKNNFALVLDNVRSMNNIGSAFRTADCFSANELLLTGICAQPPHRDISKTALGADHSVAWQYFEHNQLAIRYLLENNYQIICIEQVSNSVMLQNFMVEKHQKYAFVFGNEVLGVSDDFLAAATQCLEIPQFGTKHSLNISVTVGIVSWSFLQKSIFM
jgi:23S rRNA (guanosine2251-2'-O)-methyltransferase